jgi:hypothetical protein
MRCVLPMLLALCTLPLQAAPGLQAFAASYNRRLGPGAGQRHHPRAA